MKLGDLRALLQKRLSPAAKSAASRVKSKLESVTRYTIVGFDQALGDSQVENWLAQCGACRRIISIGDGSDTEAVCTYCGAHLTEDESDKYVPRVLKRPK